MARPIGHTTEEKRRAAHAKFRTFLQDVNRQCAVKGAARVAAEMNAAARHREAAKAETAAALDAQLALDSTKAKAKATRQAVTVKLLSYRAAYDLVNGGAK